MIWCTLSSKYVKYGTNLCITQLNGCAYIYVTVVDFDTLYLTIK